MPQTQQDVAQRLKSHFSIRVINESRYLVESWRSVQQTGWNPSLARTMFQAAERLLRHAQRYDQEEHCEIAELLLECFHQIEQERGRLSTETIENLDQLMLRLAETRLKSVNGGNEGRSRSRVKPLYIAIADPQQAQYLAEQLEFYGLPVEVLPDADALHEAFRKRYPLVLVMDVDFAGDGQGLLLVGEVQSRVETPVPVIFYSREVAPVMLRLAAVRVGGEAFLFDELEASTILEMIENTVAPAVVELSRVLVVDDSRAQAMLTERILNAAAIITRSVNNPMLALKELDEFNPDLVILDMYMPECSGPELAKMIRQCERFDSIPIIYQSAEEDLDKQLWAMRQGADDFLTKPVRPNVLTATVRNRVVRARSLKAHMVRDSLTGLYNHTHTQQLLAESCIRARRNATPLSVAMLDIDHFKQVNDQFGHPQGDRVIKTLAMLLKQRLRKTDYIGRYGGEEFVLILPGCNVLQAVKVVNALLERFRSMEFQTEQGRLQCTFSAGVAECELNSERAAIEWIAVADQALYRAKDAGRNQVMAVETGSNSDTL